MLAGKRIIIGITGGISAYKVPILIRLLKKKGAELKCVLTPDASDFVTPLTLATTSQNPVYSEFWDRNTGEWTNHVELGLWGDLIIIAPLTANTLSKLAHGFCDNLLCATYLSARCPVMIAPAMDLDMYAHPTTTENIEKLNSCGVKIIPPEEGFLASGLIGKGRMAEPEKIVEEIENFFLKNQTLKNQKILITAGPTYESIDPVRFIGNHSSGKMGFALAENCLKRGAEIILVSGPTKLKLKHKNLTTIKVQSAEEMLTAALENFKHCTGGIFSAAVADYRPKTKADLKIKKSADELVLELVKNPDILQTIGEQKKGKQWLIGFALETNDAIQNAEKKLHKKNLDFIVINSMEDEGAGFEHDTNKITILDKSNKITGFELSSKDEVAKNILDYLINFII